MDRNQQALIDYFPLLQEWSVKAQPVPAHVVIHTDARRRTIRLDNLAIEFKQTAPSKLYWAGRPAMRIVQALRWLKDTLPTDRDRILAQLSVNPKGPADPEVLLDVLHGSAQASRLMRYFFRVQVPVRMGLAHGTWHVQRFSFDVVDSKTITRAVFYGTAVVRAHNAERYGGKGCQIFLHPSIGPDAIAQIQTRVRVLEIASAHADAPNQLNFLHEEDLEILPR